MLTKSGSSFRRLTTSAWPVLSRTGLSNRLKPSKVRNQNAKIPNQSECSGALRGRSFSGGLTASQHGTQVGALRSVDWSPGESPATVVIEGDLSRYRDGCQNKPLKAKVTDCDASVANWEPPEAGRCFGPHKFQAKCLQTVHCATILTERRPVEWTPLEVLKFLSEELKRKRGNTLYANRNQSTDRRYRRCPNGILDRVRQCGSRSCTGTKRGLSHLQV